MIEILVRAETSTNILSGRYGKGFPVVAALSPCNWGGCECPPSFVIVKVTDTDDTSDWNTPWKRTTSYEILQHDPVSDSFRVKIFPTDKKSAAALTVEAMQQFLLDWGAEKIESDDPDFGVIFEITAMDAIDHRGLFTFGQEDDYVRYAETEYDPASGAHKVSMDFSLSTLTEDVIRRILGEAGMDINSMDMRTGTCIFTGYRHKMIGMLEQQVADKFNTMITRVRWRFSDAVVADALANGGVKEMTFAEAEADMIDVAEEV